AEATADGNLEAGFISRRVAHNFDTDIVHIGGGAILLGSAHGDFEFARQKRELRVEGRPLANDFAVGARIFDLIGGDAGKLIGGGVADTVAAGLNRVHFNAGEFGENIRHFFQL